MEKRKLYQLAKYQRITAGIEIAKAKFLEEQIRKQQIKRVRRNPFFKALLAKAKKTKQDLSVINEAEEVSSGSDNEKHSNSFVLTLSSVISARKNQDPTSTIQAEKSSILASFEKT